LVREGIALERIFVTGNPIKEVIEKFAPQIRASKICADLRVEEKKYFLVTMHRAENVDIPERLKGLVSALTSLHARYGFPVICSFHPRTRAKVKEFGIDIERQGVHFVEPLGFFDFVHLEQRAFCVLSDSGTVQEEACLFGVANVTIRDVTERPETVECGSNVLSGGDEKQILELVELVTRSRNEWTPPAEYLATNVSDTVARIVLGYRMPDLAELKWRGQA
jgi:UDP-N-acetylglucosamine 2-epimerase (non-hydrolysing)